MIKAQYTPGSRLGNQMTQYASLYSLSRQLNYRLSIPPIDGFPRTLTSLQSGVVFDTPGEPHALDCRHFINRDAIHPSLSKTIVNHECAYLENIYNFNAYRDSLRDTFALPSFQLDDYTLFRGAPSRPQPIRVDAISPKDIVISLRIGDFLYSPNATARWQQCVYSRFLGFEYFSIILRLMQFDRLFITSDEPFHPLVCDFSEFDPILVQNDTPIKTMAFIQKFSRVAISESTFSWWAAYLTDASEIYFPIPKNGLWGINSRWNASSSTWDTVNGLNQIEADLYLRVDDDRYKYVHQESGVIYRYQDAPGKRSREEFIPNANW